MSSRLLVPASILVYINSRLYGKVSSFRYDLSSVHKPIYGLDSGEPFEFIPTTTKVVGTMQIYRIAGDGGPEGDGMTAHFADLPIAKYFSVSLVDRRTNMVVFEALECVVQNQSWEISGKNLVTGTISFEAKDYSNEFKPFTQK